MMSRRIRGVWFAIQRFLSDQIFFTQISNVYVRPIFFSVKTVIVIIVTKNGTISATMFALSWVPKCQRLDARKIPPPPKLKNYKILIHL